MDKDGIIKSVKRQEEDKVAFSLKLPASLKDKLQEISEKESVSMNSLIVAVLQSFINDECGEKLKKSTRFLIEYKETLSINLELLVSSPRDESYAVKRVQIEAEMQAVNALLKEILLQ